MTQTLQEFQAKFRVQELLIAENDSWAWSLRPVQPTLGSGILSLKRYALTLSELTEKEATDFEKIVKVIEATTKSAFDYNIMNYLMLMMVDHHVHYHVLPRYDGNRTCGSLDWKDTGWPALPDITGEQHSGALDAVLKELKHHL